MERENSDSDCYNCSDDHGKDYSFGLMHAAKKGIFKKAFRIFYEYEYLGYENSYKPRGKWS